MIELADGVSADLEMQGPGSAPIESSVGEGIELLWNSVKSVLGLAMKAKGPKLNEVLTPTPRDDAGGRHFRALMRILADAVSSFPPI
jgi:hypothetical protein